MKMHLVRRAFALLVGTIIASVATRTWAAKPTKTQLALDLDFAHPVKEPSVDAGGGGALRLGQQLDLVALSLTGEFGVGYHSFGGAADPRDYAAFAGGRIAIGKFLEPGAFIHVGASRLESDTSGSWAPAMDFGLSLDLTLFPLVDLGVHGSYVHRFATSDASTFRYVILGPHVALMF